MTGKASGRPRVVIVGGGFGGLAAAKSLGGSDVDVVVIDRRNHHLFQPLLYQVATAALSPADIASPIRHVLRKSAKTEVVLGAVTGIDVDAQVVRLRDGGEFRYDYLVLAAGAIDQYFGNDQWAPAAPGMKSIEDALEIRRRFLRAFETAEREPDPEIRRELLTTVIIGAGATGVEMAGAMADMARHSFVKDFRRIDPSTARIILIEGGPRVLPAYDPELSAYAESDLQHRGVEVRTSAMVSKIEPDGVWIGDERIAARTIVWAAGVAASPLGEMVAVEIDRGGRVIVEPDLSVPGRPEIFVIGDMAAAAGADGKPLPGLAPVAQQQGRWVARNIARDLAGQRREPFRYRDRGAMATIGRGAAVAEIRGMKLRGNIAWLTWIFVHILFLIGFRNRLVVLLEWAWAYFTWQRGARLITGREVGLGERGIEGPP